MAHMWRSAGNLQGWFSPSTMWVPGTELRFTHWATLKAQAPLFEKDWLVINVCCVRAYVNVCVVGGISAEPEESGRSPQAGVTGRCKLPDMSSGVWSCWPPRRASKLLSMESSLQPLKLELLTAGLSTTQNGFVDNAHTNMHSHARPHMLIVPYSLFYPS